MDIFEKLAKRVHSSPGTIKKIIFINKEKNNYNTFILPKRNGGIRDINAPKYYLKFLQKNVLELIKEYYNPLECVMGFVDGRSIIDNAKIHVDSRFVLNIDLKDFFNTINFGRVRGMFINKPFTFSPSESTILARIVCKGNMLPQGAPTSPIISNIIAYRLDSVLKKYCKYNHCKYSRYADDITISTNAFRFPEKIAYKSEDGVVILGEKIKKIIETENGFTINYEKLRLSSLMERQEVTGLIVNEKVNVNKKFIKDTRAILNNMQKEGKYEVIKKFFNLPQSSSKEQVEKYEKTFIRSLAGRINFIRDVRGKYDRIFLKYAGQFNKLIGKEVFCINELVERKRIIQQKICVIEDISGVSQGTGSFVSEYGIVTSVHILLNNDTTGISRQKFLDSPEKVPEGVCVKEKTIDDEKIVYEKMNFELFKRDVMSIKNRFASDNSFAINLDYNLEIGTKVIVAGYSEFENFEKTDVTIFETNIISQREYLGIKMKCVDKPFYHGMSGGPILNENLELVGIIYAGHGDEIDVNNGFIPIRDIIEILKNIDK